MLSPSAEAQGRTEVRSGCRGRVAALGEHFLRGTLQALVPGGRPLQTDGRGPGLREAQRPRWVLPASICLSVCPGPSLPWASVVTHSVVSTALRGGLS